MKTINLRDILTHLGFQEVWNGFTDQQPSYQYDFGNLQLTAAQVVSKYFKTIFLFGGVVSGRNSISEVQFEMPLEVETYKQGVAWIVSGIGSPVSVSNSMSMVQRGTAVEENAPLGEKTKGI